MYNKLKLFLLCAIIKAEKGRSDFYMSDALPQFDLIDEFDSFRDEIAQFRLPRYVELPDVGLYMDQVVTITEKYFDVFADEDRTFITPSMINNYVKMGILKPPVKKRYGRDHVAKLIMICLLKQVLSMNEIAVVVKSDDDDIKSTYDDFRDAQVRVFTDMDITPDASVVELTMMALVTKLYAQKLVKIQIDEIKEKTAMLAEENKNTD